MNVVLLHIAAEGVLLATVAACCIIMRNAVRDNLGNILAALEPPTPPMTDEERQAAIIRRSYRKD